MQRAIGKLVIRAKPSSMAATVVTWAVATVLLACLQGGALAMVPNPFDCIGNVRCAKDPCASPPKCATSVPDATCLPNYCTGQEWDGEPFPACSALWRDPATNTIIEDCVSGAGGGDEAGGDEGGPDEGCNCRGLKTAGPVCATAANLTYASACEATCAGVTVFEEGACAVEGEPRGCITLFAPVCATAANKTYSNSCFAAIAGVTKYTKGECGSTTVDEDGSCLCEGDILDPVCATAANKTYSSTCEAKCAGVTVTEDGACAVEQGPRPCTREFNPVCAAGVANYSNPCLAKVAGVTEYTMGLCGMGGGKPGDGCACDGTSGPVCASAANLTYASACEATCAGVTVFEEGACAVEGEPRGCITLFAPVCATAANKTYSNSCFAAIAGVTKCTKGACGSDTGGDDGGCPCDELVLQPVCATAANKTYSSSCQAKCAGVSIIADGACPVEGEPRFCITLFDPVCANGVKTYGNGCEAGAAGATEITPGACNGEDDDDPWATCPTNKTVECFANPCDVNSCPIHPDATCMSNYCVGRVYRGRVLGPCEALFLDANGEPLMDCRDCSKCPLDYEPVCTTDGTTYPNRCSAECSGRRVKRDGKCIKCLGNSCKAGSFNEICQLRSKQCGKFLGCVLPAGGKPGPTDVFGRCRPQMVIGKGRRRSLIGQA